MDVGPPTCDEVIESARGAADRKPASIIQVYSFRSRNNSRVERWRFGIRSFVGAGDSAGVGLISFAFSI